jgi:hypothetical protein
VGRNNRGSGFALKRAQILRHVMRWGISHSGGWTIDRSIPASVLPVNMLVERELLQQVQETAAAHRVSTAGWLREAMRQVTVEDFPTSWRAEATPSRSHESGYYRRKFGMLLDAVTSHKLEALTKAFHRPAAEVIRQLIAQATPRDFPESWHLAAHGRQHHPSR